MDLELITKKELLEITGISYGALYRWKRLKLLPDEWFIHRSTVTGHETFFPREKVLERVETIQKLKEEMSLEEIAKRFRPGSTAEIQMSAGEAADAGISSTGVINQFLMVSGITGSFTYEALLKLQVFDRMLQKGFVNREEAYEAACAVFQAEQALHEPVVYLCRKFGVFYCVMAAEMDQILFSQNTVQLGTIHVNTVKSELTSLLNVKGVTL